MRIKFRNNNKQKCSTMKKISCLIDNHSKSKQFGSRILIVFLLIGSVVSAQTVESGQFTTTVKKELVATTTTTTESIPNFNLAGLPETSSLDDAAADGRANPGGEDVVPEALLPDQRNLFSKDAIDVRALGQMDCHMRNMDYCYAGMMGASSKALPETDSELEVRCDEMRAMTSCIALYNRRCQTMKIFSMLAPMANFEQQISPVMMSSSAAADGGDSDNVDGGVGQIQVPLNLASGSTSTSSNSKQSGNNRAASSEPPTVKLADLTALCSPEAKTNSKANKQIRQQLFQIARCVNQRVPTLTPCIEDLKAAIQLFYEPRRALPLKPTCCALSRFRSCSMGAMDGVCGLNSFVQLENSLTSGPTSMLKVIDRVCRQDSSKFESPFCQEVLPPSGMKAPQRRGQRASKLAKALDLISFAPAAQPGF